MVLVRSLSKMVLATALLAVGSLPERFVNRTGGSILFTSRIYRMHWIGPYLFPFPAVISFSNSFFQQRL
jgi:hypothetical protein